eukprot:14176547-Ditylum_brightwellii.AAC.1
MELGQSNFIIATGGSSGTDSMSFGWKIYMQQRKMLVQYSGPAFGQTSLFRLYLDNETVITRVHQQKDYPYNYPFNTLASNWDVIAQVVVVLNKTNFNEDFQHVKGHQDKDKQYHELSLPAQLN